MAAGFMFLTPTLQPSLPRQFHRNSHLETGDQKAAYIGVVGDSLRDVCDRKDLCI